MSPKRSKLKIVLIIIGSLLVFCLGKTIYGVIIENKVYNNLKAELLNTEKLCELPCWKGITPGETKVFKALSILALDSDVNSFWWLFRDNQYGKHMAR